VSCWESDGDLLNFFAMIRLMRCGEQARSSAGCQSIWASGVMASMQPDDLRSPCQPIFRTCLKLKKLKRLWVRPIRGLQTSQLVFLPHTKKIEGSSLLAQGMLGAAF